MFGTLHKKWVFLKELTKKLKRTAQRKRLLHIYIVSCKNYICIITITYILFVVPYIYIYTLFFFISPRVTSTVDCD